MKITQTKKGLYTTVISLGRENGKVKTKRFTAPSKPELLLAVATFNGEQRDQDTRRTFSDALKAYLEAREPHRSPSTLRGYKIIERGLTKRFPSFCGREVAKITDDDVQRIIDTLFRNDYSQKTIRNWTGLINSVLIAEKRQPARVIMPQKKIVDRPIPSEGEVRMLLCLLHGHPLEVPFNLALLSMRRAEICAVTSEDVDKDGILHVYKTVVSPDGGGDIIKETPKTDTSNRYIQLPPRIADLIRKNGRATDHAPSGLTRAYRMFLEKYRFPPYRLHDCRHFYASYCHSKGVPEADILAGGG